MRNEFEKRKNQDGKTVMTKIKSKLYSKDLREKFRNQRAKTIEDAVWRQNYCKGKISLKHRSRLSCDVCGDPIKTQMWPEWCDVCGTAFLPGKGKGKKSPQKEKKSPQKAKKTNRKGRHDQCCITCRVPYYEIKEKCKCAKNAL